MRRMWELTGIERFFWPLETPLELAMVEMSHGSRHSYLMRASAGEQSVNTSNAKIAIEGSLN